MEIVGEFLGINSDKEIWSYFRSHWLSFFPNIGSRSSFTRQSANLYIIKQKLHEKMLVLNPFWKRSFIGFSCLGIFAWTCNHFFEHKSSILTSSAQEKADNLTPIERVKSLHESAQLKNDPIADINTQKLLSKSISKNLDPLKINLDAKEDKNLPLNLNQEHNLSNAAKENACDPYDAALGKCPLSKEYQENMDIIAQKISLQTKSSLKDANTNGSSENSIQIEENYTDAKKEIN